jgi:hypothetical protein
MIPQLRDSFIPDLRFAEGFGKARREPIIQGKYPAALKTVKSQVNAPDRCWVGVEYPLFYHKNGNQKKTRPFFSCAIEKQPSRAVFL